MNGIRSSTLITKETILTSPQTLGLWYSEIFYVAEDMLCVPKLYVPIPTCMLRVINNDTGKELPKVFQKVAPYVFKKNKKGYTFIAEARSTDQVIPAGRWRMRLIGSLSPLPAPIKNEVNSNFHTREIRDYYVPNDKMVIFRYSVRAFEDHLTSLQVTTSKPDVYVQLSVLDNEEELLSSVGKGHVVLPAVLFHKDNMDEVTADDSKRTSSRASGRGAAKTVKGKRSSSQEDRLSRQSTRMSETSMENEEEITSKRHKYVIQATVLRQSWPLSEVSWAFVQQLKEMEKTDLKDTECVTISISNQSVQNRDQPAASSQEKAAVSPAAKAKDKGKGKAGKDKDKDKGSSRPPSTQFDVTKPNWILRIVSDGSAAEDLEVKKDTERADEIRALKKAWEDAEPGRATKAMQSRLQYLRTHMVKVRPDDVTSTVDDEVTDTLDASGNLTEPSSGAPPAVMASLEPPRPGSATAVSLLDGDDTILSNKPPAPPEPTQVLQPLDLTPFLRHNGPPRIKDEAEEEQQLAERQAEIAEYRNQRQQVMQWRQKDKQRRNQAKITQLQQAEAMQAALDAAREAINVPREAFRQTFLEAEKRRLEEIAAVEAAMKADLEKSNPSPKGKKGGSAKGKKGKK